MMTAATGRRPLAGLASPRWPSSRRSRTVAAIWGWFRPEPPRPVSRYGLAFPEGQAPTGPMALSPDGSRLVYVGPGADGGTQIWMKERSQYAATPLAGTTGRGAPDVLP